MHNDTRTWRTLYIVRRGGLVLHIQKSDDGMTRTVAGGSR